MREQNYQNCNFKKYIFVWEMLICTSFLKLVTYFFSQVHVGLKETILVILFLSLQFSPPTSASSKAILGKVTDVIAKVANVGLGTYSRSTTVSALSKLLRGEDSVKVRESLNQVISTLALLDIGGGILVPGIQHMVDAIVKDTAFKETRRAFAAYNGKLVGQLNRKSWSSMKSADMKKFLKVQKQKILSTFSDDVAKLSRHSKALKHINRAKNLFRVKSVAKVLGPLFDTIAVGINSWGLSIAIRDCNNDPKNCNRGAIASASLGIASGIIGAGTFVAALVTTGTVSAVLGPVGAVVSVVLAICATLIELFYPDPARLNAIRREQKLSFMRQLDQYSRRQLYAVHRFMAEKKVERGDVYVVNQALLPRYFKPNDELVFGKDTAKNPRKNVFIPGKCYDPWDGVARFSGHLSISSNHLYCPTLVDGMKISLESKNDETGYGFYGFTKNARSYEFKNRHLYKPSEEYNGSIVLINTDQVQRSVLRKQREAHLNQELRSIRINTEEKGKGGAYDDLVAVGNMGNLHRDAWVRIRTGDGNDVLNIDGLPSRQVGKLEAILGSGYNTLSFLGMPEDENFDINGIEYDPQSQKLHYFHGSGRRRHYVGTVGKIKILSASPFQDVVHLFASKKSQKGDDFTVFKFKGKAEYIIDIKKVAKSYRETGSGKPFMFKIIDNTDNGQSGDTKCNNHNPLLKIINTGTSGVANDILYRADSRQIWIYGKDRSQQNGDDILGSADNPSNAATSPLRRCSGEPGNGNHPKGGVGKKLLAIVSFQTKCSGEVKADTDENGNCMMATRKVTELDLIFYDGNHYFSDFTRDVKTTQPTSPKISVCTLKCPQNQVTSSTKIEIGLRPTGVLVIRSDLFLDPCDLGREGVLRLKKISCLLWELQLEGTLTKFTGGGKRHQLYGFNTIVNENGDTIVDLSQEKRIAIDLYKVYAKKKVNTMAESARRERSKEVANSLEECYKRSRSPSSANICRP